MGEEYNVVLYTWTLCVFFSSSRIELPYGWEKVNDPVYGTYFIE